MAAKNGRDKGREKDIVSDQDLQARLDQATEEASSLRAQLPSRVSASSDFEPGSAAGGGRGADPAGRDGSGALPVHGSAALP